VATVTKPVLEIRDASMTFGARTLWSNLNLAVQPHEFIAVIGSNGSGKSTLLKTILGQQELTEGGIKVLGRSVRNKRGQRGNRRIGYIPQNRAMDTGLPLRGRDLLHFGLDGHEFGLPHLPFSKHTREHKRRVERMIEAIGASAFANKTVGTLSGGELQRLRVGQAVIGEPRLILADEPLSALDLHQQKTIAELLDRERREHEAAVLFVTHDVNPVLDMVDRVLYLANGKFSIGIPDEVLRSDVLSELYGTPVDVVRNQGRIVVVGTHEHDHHPDEEWN
jgi:zinc/manganese transport system ATP-binding protein